MRTLTMGIANWMMYMHSSLIVASPQLVDENFYSIDVGICGINIMYKHKNSYLGNTLPLLYHLCISICGRLACMCVLSAKRLILLEKRIC